MTYNRLPRCLEYEKVMKVFYMLGWSRSRSVSGRGKHIKLVRDDRSFPIPKKHPGGVRSSAVLNYLRKAQISKEEFINTLSRI